MFRNTINSVKCHIANHIAESYCYCCRMKNCSPLLMKTAENMIKQILCSQKKDDELIGNITSERILILEPCDRQISNY
jgi:hypothetical protein